MKPTLFRSGHAILIVSTLFAIFPFSVEAAQADAASPKKLGTVRLGLLVPQDGISAQGDTQAGEAVRTLEAGLLTGTTSESIFLDARSAAQAMVEAKARQCDYVLSSTLTQQPSAQTSRFGKLMNLRNAQVASSAVMLAPHMGSTGTIASELSSQAMQNQVSTATRPIKANSDVTFEYTLTAVDGKVTLSDKATAHSKSNGEDVLTPLLTEAANKVLAAAKPVTNLAEGAETQASSTPNAPASLSLVTFKNYDFVPGDKIAFDDDFAETPDGDFPEKWELLSGQASVNQQAGKTAFVISAGDPAQMKARLKGTNPLGTQFTLEFDVFGVDSQWGPEFYFESDRSRSPSLRLRSSIAEFIRRDAETLSGNYPDEIRGDKFVGHWHHIAISYKLPQLKVYVDQYRVLYVPDTKIAPLTLILGGEASPSSNIVFAHVRLATGGGANYVGKRFTETKIVTHGINFDVDTATLQAESMGTLNQIKKLMESDSSLNFEVDGHTDNSGNAAHNLQLSEQRANAVKGELVSMGIDAGRLTVKGFGDTKPLGPNSTPEDKANNRRVEFVRR